MIWLWLLLGAVNVITLFAVMALIAETKFIAKSIEYLESEKKEDM